MPQMLHIHTTFLFPYGSSQSDPFIEERPRCWATCRLAHASRACQICAQSQLKVSPLHFLFLLGSVLGIKWSVVSFKTDATCSTSLWMVLASPYQARNQSPNLGSLMSSTHPYPQSLTWMLQNCLTFGFILHVAAMTRLHNPMIMLHNHWVVYSHSTVGPALAVTWIRQSPSHCSQLGQVLKLLPIPTVR